MLLLALLHIFQSFHPSFGEGKAIPSNFIESAIERKFEEQVIKLVPDVKINEMIFLNSGVKIIGCSRKTHANQEFHAIDLGSCLATNYFELRFFKNENPIEVYYSRGSASSHFSLHWKPNFDSMPVELEKLKKYAKDYLAQKSHCDLNPAASAQDFGSAQEKYVSLRSFRSPLMHSYFGEITLTFENSNDLPILLNIPKAGAQLSTIDQIEIIKLDLQMDPMDIENSLGKIDVYRRGDSNAFVEKYFQFKENLSCLQTRIVLDAKHAN